MNAAIERSKASRLPSSTVGGDALLYQAELAAPAWALPRVDPGRKTSECILSDRRRAASV